MTRITFEKVTKRFGKTEFLKDFSLEIRDKELMVLLGPSSSGKSLLLKLIAGIEEPSSGTIYFDDVDVTRVSPRKRDVSLVFQSYALYPNKTVFENLAFPLQNRGVPKKEIEEAVKSISLKLGLEPVLSKRPGLLSGGERQRVALGRAMIRKPRVYLFDSPLTNLDAKLRTTTRTEIKRLHREIDATTVYATPDQLEATTIADRITLLKDGKIAQIATPNVLYQKPGSLFAASFVGNPKINLLPCMTGTSDGRSLELIFEDYRFTTSISSASLSTFPSKIMLGVRPEDILITRNIEKGFPGKVDITEETRPEVTVAVKLGSKTTLLALIPSTEDRFRVDEEVRFSFDEAKMHFFDPETGKTLEVRETG